MSATAARAAVATPLEAHVVVGHAHLDVSLRVPAGEVLAVMGPSGAGKTTLLHALAGLTRMDAGRIVLGDVVLADARTHVPPARRGVGLLGQEALLFPHMSAAANIAFAARAVGLDRAEANDAAAAWLERTDLADLADRRPHQLSGGQRQRVALARALAARPRLLLLDEPFSSLDVEAASRLRETVAAHLPGTTTVVVSHSAADAEALADRLVVIERGRIVQDGTVDAVLDSPATTFAAAVAMSAGRR
jgi:molybdate transport system ATP-binding protein/molybdopterin molybdotransferase